MANNLNVPISALAGAELANSLMGQRQQQENPIEPNPKIKRRQALRDFTSDLMFTLAQSLSATASAPGQRGTAAGLAAAIAGPSMRRTLVQQQEDERVKMEQERQKFQLDMENQQLQNQKLRGDIVNAMRTDFQKRDIMDSTGKYEEYYDPRNPLQALGRVQTGPAPDVERSKMIDEYVDDNGQKVLVFQTPTGETFTETFGTVGASPRAPVPGTDIPYPPDVLAQKIAIAAAGADGQQPNVIGAYVAGLATGALDVTSVPAEVRGAVLSAMQAHNIPLVTTAQATAGRQQGATSPIFDQIKELSERINTGEGISARLSGIRRGTAARLNYDTDVSLYTALISGFTPLVARALGHTGVLTEQDVQSARELFPKVGDSKDVASGKMALIERIMSGVEGAITEGRSLTGVGGAAREGVTAPPSGLEDMSDDELFRILGGR